LLKKGGLAKPEKATVSEEALKPEMPKKVASDVQEQVENLCKRSEALLRQGKDDEAVKCFVQALALDEFHQETHHRLAMPYLKKQMFGAAAALFKQLGEVTGDPVHYSHLGLALYQQSNYPEALSAYQKAVEIDDSRPQRFISLAQVYRAMGKTNNAIVALKKSIEIDEQNLDNIFLLADLQIELENYDEAEVILKKLLEIEPEYVEAKTLLSELRKIKEA